MLTVPVFNMSGERTGEVSIDPLFLGGFLRPRLIKQAVVAYLDRQRQFSARTKSKSDTEGSTRKLYRQKGTGNARAGAARTPVRRGGGRAFAQRIPRAHVDLPKKMRRLARNSAILAKLQSNEVMVIDPLHLDVPKTKVMASLFRAIGVDRGCILAMHERNVNVLRSSRNIPGSSVRLVDDVHAYEILTHRKLVMTRLAFDRLAKDLATPSTSSDSTQD